MSAKTLAGWAEDARDEIFDLRQTADLLVDALDCADSCETDSDVLANVREAHDQAVELVRQLAELLRAAPKVKS